MCAELGHKVTSDGSVLFSGSCFAVRLKSLPRPRSAIITGRVLLCRLLSTSFFPLYRCLAYPIRVAMSTIRLRDSPAQVQEKLGLSNRQFDNFKNFARRVHGEYCAAHPSSRWADVSVVWTAVPEREKLDVIRLMYNLCIESNLFPLTTGRATIEAGIEQRLHQVRRTWQQTSRTRTRPSAHGDD